MTVLYAGGWCLAITFGIGYLLAELQLRRILRPRGRDTGVINFQETIAAHKNGLTLYSTTKKFKS